jgi:hypothetical protein
MRVVLELLGVCSAALMLSGAAQAQTAEEGFVHQRLARAGFTPLDEMTFGGRDVRRVLPVDPYGMLPIPGIELERHADGRLTLRAQYRGWTGEVYDVSPGEWQQVLGLEAAAYAQPAKSSTRSDPNVMVHCWSGFLEVSPDKAASWWGCNDGTRPAQAYTEAVLTLTMRKMDCQPSEKKTLWRFSECLARTRKLDDPTLAAKLTELQARWEKQRIPGSEILARARLALRAARATRTETLVATAQDAVFAFGRQQEALRTILETGFYPLQAAEGRGGGNAVIVDDTRRNWLEDINSQQQNYIGLLEELARIQAHG